MRGSWILRLIEVYVLSWAKEKGVGGVGFQRPGRQFIGKWEMQMCGKQKFVLPRRYILLGS